jgi:hypothetical protein
MNSKILILMTIAALPLGCGKIATDDAGKSSAFEFKEAYQFNVNGCDTGRHEFTASSADEVKRQLCDALQDDSRNSACAESTRLDMFTRKCPGLGWSPKRATATSPEPARQPRSDQPPETPQSPSLSPEIDEATATEIQNALSFIIVEKYEIAPNLLGIIRTEASQFAESLMSCGLNRHGSRCLDFSAKVTSHESLHGEKVGTFEVYTEFSLAQSNESMAFRFTLGKIAASLRPIRVEVLQTLKPRSPMDAATFLKDRANSAVLITLFPAHDFRQSAWQLLQRPKDIRHLYHLSKTLFEDSRLTNSSDSSSPRLIGLIRRSKALLAQSKDDLLYRECSRAFDFGSSGGAPGPFRGLC